jgi:ferric-dicitrate binding protein FerR (iron transport regulator)
VVLRKGKVQLNYVSTVGSENKTLVLKPGDKFVKNERGADEVHLNNVESVVAWKNHDFLFEGTALAEVANIIKDNFGIKLIFQNDTLANRKISGTFHAEKADELIDAIAQLLDVNYKKKNNVIYFFD